MFPPASTAEKGMRNRLFRLHEKELVVSRNAARSKLLLQTRDISNEGRSR